MKKINKTIASKKKKINYLGIDWSRILEMDGIGKSQVLEMVLALRSSILERNLVEKPQILDAEEVQGSGKIGPGFWKELNKLIFMNLYSIKLEVGSWVLEGIDRWMYKW